MIIDVDVPVPHYLSEHDRPTQRLRHTGTPERCLGGEEAFVRTRKAGEANLSPNYFADRALARRRYGGEELTRAATGEAPRMSRQGRSRKVSDGDPAVVPAGLVDVFDDRAPDDALGGIIRAAWLPTHTQHSPHRRAYRPLVAPDQNDRWGAVAGDVRAGRVRDQPQVPVGQDLLDELAAKLAFHERVRRDLPDPAGRLPVVPGLGQAEEPLHERHGERVLALAGGVPVPVGLVEHLVFDRDVRRLSLIRISEPTRPY